MLGNHLVSELLCWKVEFSLSVTAQWYTSNKPNRSYFGDDPVAYQSHRGQEQNTGFRIKWKHRHTGLHTSQTRAKRACSHAGLPRLQSKFDTCRTTHKKKVHVWKILTWERKTDGWRGRYLSSTRTEGSKALFTALPLAHSSTAELFRFPMPWLTRQYNGYNTSSCP